MNEIDITEWLDEDIDRVNRFRLAQGDLEVAKNSKKKICVAIPNSLTIVKHLVSKGIFPYHYEIYGVGFLELRSAFRSPWAFRKMTGLVEHLGRGLSNSQVEVIYEKVCKKTGLDHILVVEYLMDTMAPKDMIGQDPRWKDSFERLIVAMDESRREAEE